MTAPHPPCPAPPGRVRTVSVGTPQTYTWLGRELVSSIFKTPATGPVAVDAEGLTGDEQSDRKSHGGRDKAVYAYAREDEDWWESETGRPFPDGAFGENLTTTGLDLTNAAIGQTWQVGTAVLQVTEPRTPCWKLGLKMDDPAFPRRAAASRRPGVLLRVLQDGVLAAGDAVVLGPVPAHGITAAAINRIYYGEDRDLSPIWDAPELAAHWRTWAGHRTVWHEADAALGRLGPG
ncbi:MOSC domain-containing protein YiiM [Friedmanniella luteola]|uniref:MOSC domain-containing protein YiiM n=1 Tax=Friedmanniella luteola TaxID=546871 RepID=A0A1H1ZG31_9ACTN|nr:MOSC domain-containing protein [Friedmanniella luteola]SDT32452.1 MOSC domain-containing protein YiiM [Friedmanniella luteola]